MQEDRKEEERTARTEEIVDKVPSQTEKDRRRQNEGGPARGVKKRFHGRRYSDF